MMTERFKLGLRLERCAASNTTGRQRQAVYAVLRSFYWDVCRP